MWEKQTLRFFNISKILQENQQKHQISGVFWAFKSKLQIIHAVTYITLFLPDSNNCFFLCLVPYIHISLYYFLILCFYFHFLFLTYLWFDFITICPQHYRDKKILQSLQQKKKSCVNYNQTKCSILVVKSMSFSSLLISLLSFSIWSDCRWKIVFQLSHFKDYS